MTREPTEVSSSVNSVFMSHRINKSMAIATSLVLLISAPFEHSVCAVNYSVVVLKGRQPPEVVQIGSKV